MGGLATAELGHHTEEHDRNGLVVEKRRSWRGNGKCLHSISFFFFLSFFFSSLYPQQESWWNVPSSALKVSLMIFHSGLSAGSSCCIVSTIRYMILSSTLRSVLSAREMAGFRTALLQAALLLKGTIQMLYVIREMWWQVIQQLLFLTAVWDNQSQVL